MELNLKFSEYVLIIIFALIIAEIIRNVVKYIANKYDYETYYILQNTLFYNLNTLYYGGITVINVLLVIAFFNKENLLTLLPIALFSILYFTPSVYKKLRMKFEYNKYNTSLNYYCANKKDTYRRRVYHVMMKELEEFDWDEIQNSEIKEIFLRDINPYWESIIPFELFDEKLFQSTSNKTIGTLVYVNFTKNILSYIKTIEKVTSKNLEYAIDVAFNSAFLLKFNNDIGFYYDNGSLETLVRLNNDSLRRQTDSLLLKKIYSELLTLAQSNKELHSIDVDKIMDQFQSAIEFKEKVIQEIIEKTNSSTKTIIKLPSGLQHSKIFQKIKFKFVANKIHLTTAEEKDIKHFIASRFKSNGNGYKVTQADYNNKNILIENFDLILNVFVDIIKNMNKKNKEGEGEYKSRILSKKELAQVLIEEFHELNLSRKSVENRL